MTDEELPDLDSLIASVQSGKLPKLADNPDQRLVGRVDLVLPEMLRDAEVIFVIRSERYFDYDKGRKYEWSAPGRLCVTCKTPLCDLGDKARECAVITACTEQSIGRTPSFITGFEWIDRDGCRWGKTFKEPYTKG